MDYFLKLLNCSVGLVGKENAAEVMVLLPLGEKKVTCGRNRVRTGGV